MGRVRSLVTLASLLLASCAPGADPLAGTAWTLEALNGDALITGTTITLTFGSGKVSRNSGCNMYGGDYTATETQLEFSALASTAIGCDAPIMAQESAYFRALGEAATYTAGGRLELTNGDNGETLSFTPD